ncbi:MAG: hypothetical protein Q3993_01610 [Filifactor alocis]|nr:hypothetical protein [Filifactor alocis]
MIADIAKYKTISITGLEKNVGKTTTLNQLIEEAKGIYTLGLTSIGRDGETVDRVTKTAKPSIYIYEGTVVATCRECLNNSDFTMEILETTKIHTPMGNIIIVRALSDGYVEIAGPSINKDLEDIIEKMQAYGPDKIFVDGALSRKSLASPSVAEATVIATGAAVVASIDKLVKETVHTYTLLSIPELEDEELKEKIEAHDEKILLIDNKRDIKAFDVLTALEINREVLDAITEDMDYIVLRGAITDPFLESIMKLVTQKKPLSLVVEDGTKLFIKAQTLEKMRIKKMKIYALKKINVVSITINPTSPRGAKLDSGRLIYALQQQIPLPVYDVKGEMI